MSTVINQRELRNSSGEVMRRVEQGECFVVTRNGLALAELRPLDDDRPQFVTREHAIDSAAGLAPIDARRFREDLDNVVDPALPDG